MTASGNKLGWLVCFLMLLGILSALSLSLHEDTADLTTAPVLEEAVEPSSGKVTVYVEEISRVFLEDFKDADTIAAFEKLQTFMDWSGLAYDIMFVPWGRAVLLTEKNDRALLFQLLRTDEREDKYHWILPIFGDEPLYLFGRTGLEVTSGMPSLSGYSAACIKDSVQCDLLLELGFDADKILVMSSSTPAALEQLLVRGRVDFILGFQYGVCMNLEVIDHSMLDVVAYKQIKLASDYLAAPLHIAEDILQKLQETRQSDLPLLLSKADREQASLAKKSAGVLGNDGCAIRFSNRVWDGS
ncbi:hypothetical protein GCM10017044_12400 [Kordiimonas sediminis]|uniref:Solute-binding protein family 3/N-terminal domain-containing protein n=1 Tax=Kordiimonas sediminis TaxID=1735581 RepID=A0A919AQ97_9PROT|nr:hypothetical protein [Kordiimonas sediminis]GHF19336.1 hypothetical protein GCM10017044_12400 [Kordiimonas sediminis]